MAASWKSGAWGLVESLCESVIDGALTVANGIDELCHPDGAGIGSCMALKCSMLSALVDGGKCSLPNPALPKYCGTVRFDLVASSFLLLCFFGLGFV